MTIATGNNVTKWRHQVRYEMKADELDSVSFYFYFAVKSSVNRSVL